MFAKFLSFPHWPAVITSREEGGLNVNFSDGSTSGVGGAIKDEKIIHFTQENAVRIIQTTKFKTGKNSKTKFKKACAEFGLMF